MIGDDYEVDVLGALNVGMQGIHFDPDKNHTKQEGHHLIHELNEIPAILPWILRSNL
jgi:FMN phosphatase YigB (HAD superfamily)